MTHSMKLIFGLFSGILVNQFAAATNPAGEKPNIIFILADDLGYSHLGCYGQTKIKTPYIDRLASEGIRFTQAYAGGPVCTPSRSVLMTGLHNGHTPARDNIPHYSTYLKKEDITVAEVLREVGYLCSGVGKWSLGDAGTVGAATNQGFDRWFGYLNQDHAHYYYPEYLDDSDRAESDYRYEIPGNTVNRLAYSHTLIVEKALQYIRDSRDKPFFLYTAFTLPHFSARSEDKDRFTVPSTDPYSEMDWDEKSKKYAAMIHILDTDVGRIVNLVDSLGLKENTLIIFASDNGGYSDVGEVFDTSKPFRGFKSDLTEGGIRVPFIARWPSRVPAGKTSSEVIAFQDMLPTFAEISGGRTPKRTDGISVLEALMGEKQKEQHHYLYWDTGHCRNRYDQAIRMGQWKGIRNGQKEKIQLYNLEKDIGEQNNVADLFPEIIRKMEAAMVEAYMPSERYPIGIEYKGKPIWKKNK